MTTQAAGAPKAPYTMRMSLGVLDHLGLNLYSNIPAVLSEVVANSWDADSTTVSIVINTDDRSISLTDDGIGMTSDDLNRRFLYVGFRRREQDKPVTPKGRHVMGRKGIGKLSLFAIANVIRVETAKDGAKAGLILRSEDIRKVIKDEEGDYHPDPIDPSEITIANGTKISLTELVHKPTATTQEMLRRRLARRFSIIGPANDFQVVVDGEAIDVSDRDFFPHIEYLWSIGNVGDVYEKLCTSALKENRIDGVIEGEKGWTISGWVGTVDEQKHITEESNVIPILAWGKLIHEDLLAAVKPAGVYAKYLMGELRADFVDSDESQDIATSDRQSLKETDPRYEALTNYLKDSILKEIGNAWRDWRRDNSMVKATQNPIVAEWYKGLEDSAQKSARQLFGKIGQMSLEDEQDRVELYKNAILAFEKLRYSDLLDQIDALGDREQIDLIARAFASIDAIEAALYGEISVGRIKIIEKFEGIVDANAKEQVLKEFLFDHIWLLDPSWERPTTNLRIESAVSKEFDDVTSTLTPEEKAGRFDIKYRTAAGKHVVIELKRYGVKVSSSQLHAQMSKYRSALLKCLKDKFPESSERPVEGIAVIGSFPDDLPPDEVIDTLKAINTRIVTYDTLIAGALESYREYLDKHEEVSRLTDLLGRLEQSASKSAEAAATKAVAVKS